MHVDAGSCGAWWVKSTDITGFLDSALEYIQTGDWITTEEVIAQMEFTETKAVKVLDFLSEFGFTEFDSDKEKIRIADLGKRLLELPEI